MNLRALGKALWVNEGRLVYHVLKRGGGRLGTAAISQQQQYESTPWYKKPFLPDNYGPEVGDDSLDDYIDEAFEERKNDPNHSSRHTWQ